MSLRKSNIAVDFFQTGEEKNRTYMTKPYHLLQNMDENETDIYMIGLLDKYAARPTSLESMCYVDFGCWYIADSKKKPFEDGSDYSGEEDDSSMFAECNTPEPFPKRIKLFPCRAYV